MAAPKYIKSKFPYVMSHSNSFRRHRWKKVLYRPSWGIAGWAWWQALVMTCKEARESTSGRIQIGDDPVTREDMDAIDCWEPLTQEFAEHLITAGWLAEDKDGCLRIVDTETWLATPSSVPEYDSERRAQSKDTEPISAENPGNCRTTAGQDPETAEKCGRLPTPKAIIKQSKAKQDESNTKQDESNAMQSKGNSGSPPESTGGDPPEPPAAGFFEEDVSKETTPRAQDRLFDLECEWTTRHVPTSPPPSLTEQDFRRWIQARQRDEPAKDREKTCEKFLDFAREQLARPTRLGVVGWTDITSAAEMAHQVADHRKRNAPPTKPIRNVLRLASTIAPDHIEAAVEWRIERQRAFDYQQRHLRLWEHEEDEDNG